jgi:cyclopropane fatty-acyl-phospholipid synthase-like methyltransferase
MDLGVYKSSFDLLLEVLPLNGKVIELGCGPGNVIKYLRSRRPDLEYLGIDLSPAMITMAREQNPGVEFRVMDIRDAGLLTEHFDAVMVPFSIPYLSYEDIPGFFTTMADLTSPGGFVYLSCMEGERSRSGFEKTSFTGDSEMHISYYPRTFLEHLFAMHGFTIERMETSEYPEQDGTTTIDLMYTAKKNAPSHDH